MRVGINGFGRIGRAIYRINMNRKDFEIPLINEINPDINNIAYMLNYDTTYGSLQDEFVAAEGRINNTNLSFHISQERYIDDVDWNSYGIEYVIDATGVKENLLRAGAVIDKNASVIKVFITHSPDEVDFTMVLGANEGELDAGHHRVISASVCDATAIAPVLKIISEHHEITGGAVTTLHPLLSYQNVLDGEARSWYNPGMIYSHYPLGRSVFDNIIPKPTSAIDAVYKVLSRVNIPCVSSFSYRIPTTIVASADITLFMRDKVDSENIKNIFYEYEKNQNYKIIKNSELPLVSLDYKQCEYSAVVDHRWTTVTDNRTLKIILWYDNEWGYASRVIDQVSFVNKQLQSSTVR